MPLEGFEFFSGCHIPQLYRIVIIRRSQSFAIRRKTHTADPIFMPFKGFGFSRCHIPQLYRIVITRRSQSFAIGRKTHTADYITMTFEGFGFSRCHIP